jgi:hypothetical protein
MNLKFNCGSRYLLPIMLLCGGINSSKNNDHPNFTKYTLVLGSNVVPCSRRSTCVLLCKTIVWLCKNHAKQVSHWHTWSLMGLWGHKMHLILTLCPHWKNYFKIIVHMYESCEGAILCGIDNLKVSLHYFLW